jgi:hypothetical protein
VRIWSQATGIKNLLCNKPAYSTILHYLRSAYSTYTGTLDMDWPGRNPDDKTVIPSIDVDENFMEVFKTKMLTGRSFSASI